MVYWKNKKENSAVCAHVCAVLCEQQRKVSPRFIYNLISKEKTSLQQIRVLMSCDFHSKHTGTGEGNKLRFNLLKQVPAGVTEQRHT